MRPDQPTPELRMADGLFVTGTAKSINHVRTIVLAADLLAEHAERVVEGTLTPRALAEVVQEYRRVRGKS